MSRPAVGGHIRHSAIGGVVLAGIGGSAVLSGRLAQDPGDNRVDFFVRCARLNNIDNFLDT